MTAVVGGAMVPLADRAQLADKMGIQHVLRHSDLLLSLHRLLRAVGSQTYADCYSVGGLGAVT